MKGDIVEKAGWLGFAFGVICAAAFLLLVFGFTSQARTHTPPPDSEYRPCYEDEVIMWDGEANEHLHCVPLDNLIGY